MRKTIQALSPVVTILAAILLFAGCGENSKPEPGSGSGEVKPAGGKGQGVHLLVEAESAQKINGTFAVAEVKDSSGGKVVKIPVLPKDFKGDLGQMELTVDLPADGKVSIWFRTLWSGNCANSFFLQPGGEGPKLTVGEDGTYGKWHWVRGPRNRMMKKGPLTLVISQREIDIAIDQVLLTSDEQYVPVGIEE